MFKDGGGVGIRILFFEKIKNVTFRNVEELASVYAFRISLHPPHLSRN